MEGLRKKLILVITLALTFLVMQLATYLYSINAFRSDLKTLEDIHAFVENVLELRRYEKNFAYYVSREDIEEVLQYLHRIKGGLSSLEMSPVASEYKQGLRTFKEHLAAYEKLANKAKTQEELEADSMRTHGHAMLLFAKDALQVNRAFIASSLRRIEIIPSTIMFLFGGSLIVALVLLTIATIKQINFIKQTTRRIAQGDFSPIDHSSVGYHHYPMIIQAFNRMITELDLRQEQLIQSKKMAAIGTLTSGIAHEVNNPLNNISLTAEAMLEEYEELPVDEGKGMLADIVSEVTRASSVVANLLDFSRAHGEMAFAVIDIRDVLKATLHLIRNQIMLSGIQLKTEYAREPLLLNGDADNLKQVFINLCLNAIHAMPDGGLLTLSAAVHEDDMIMIQVADTGVGMPVEMVEKIFDPFFTTKPVGKGTGLGLSVVYGIVKKHAGYIEVSSNIGKGTTFSVYLPQVMVDNQGASSSR